MANHSTLLIFDNRSYRRTFLRSLLDQMPEFAVTGECETAEETAATIRDTEPDIVVINAPQATADTIEQALEIKRVAGPSSVVIILSNVSDKALAHLLDAGIDGVLLTSSTAEELRFALNSVSRGKTHLAADVWDRVIRGFLGSAPGASPFQHWQRLSPREKEVLLLVAEGRANREVAAYLDLSVKTVEKHRSNFMRKLSLHNTAMIVSFARSVGILVEHRETPRYPARVTL